MKIVATLLFVLAVVATPREAVWAFALHLLDLAATGCADLTAKQQEALAATPRARVL